MSSISDEHFDPDIDDIAQAIDEMDISINDLSDYVRGIDSLAPATSLKELPRFPCPVVPQLNIPRPGCRELKERKDYIDDYLPLLHVDVDGKALNSLIFVKQ
jgi:hypothetical protein